MKAIILEHEYNDVATKSLIGQEVEVKPSEIMLGYYEDLNRPVLYESCELQFID